MGIQLSQQAWRCARKQVETIKQQGWTGPIYNDYNWGGFLIWSLDRPISIYGRNTDFGVENVLRSFATWNGSPGWDSDPDLVKANLIIAPVGSPLVQLLRRARAREQLLAFPRRDLACAQGDRIGRRGHRAISSSCLISV